MVKITALAPRNPPQNFHATKDSFGGETGKNPMPFPAAANLAPAIALAVQTSQEPKI